MSHIGKGTAIYAEIPIGCPHLYLVMTEPFDNPQKIIAVNISTVRDLPFEDHTVILHPEDHFYIKKRSFVYYDYARLINVDVLKKRLAEGRAKLFENISEELLTKIVDGALKSSYTSEIRGHPFNSAPQLLLLCTVHTEYISQLT